MGVWYTKADANGRYGYYNDKLGAGPFQLKGVSMTGFETGTRETQSGGGYWLYDPEQPSAETSLTIIKNIVATLKTSWGITAIRIPFCGSAWLQNYNVQDWGRQTLATYRQWVDTAVQQATSMGVVVLLDNHLWAIGRESNTTRNMGMEDGCTGINKVCVGVPQCVDSCAPHDWYGQYTSSRTGKTYNEGDGVDTWECSIANADGCTLDNLLRNNNVEHFYNLWHEVAKYYANNPYVFFELFNEPYQRKSAQFDDPACKPDGEGTSFMCPPGHGFGDNLDEKDYNWAAWSNLMNTTIGIIRATGATNVIQVSGLDWNYDYYGDGTAANGGPIIRPSKLMPWTTWAKNIGYSMHPYQHGACCGQVGSTSDLSANDPYQSAFCMYPPTDGSGTPVPSRGDLPIPSYVTAGSKVCDTTGYATTQDKKAPPCQWVPQAKKFGSTSMGVCAGSRDLCGNLTMAQCNAVNDTSPKAGGWSQFVLPIQRYGPLFASEFGPFDCSSPFTSAFLKYAKEHTISYSAWALWPQNSGGPGAGACGYPSILQPTGGGLDSSNGFGKGSTNCVTASSCAQLLRPMAWSGQLIHDDIKGQ